MNHCSPESLYEYADGIADAVVRNEVESHCRSCRQCEEALRTIGVWEKILRQMPPEQVSPGFTGRLMQQIGTGETHSFAWAFVRNLAPALAFLCVMGLIVFFLKISGTFDTTGLGETTAATQSIARNIGSSLSGGLSIYRKWIHTIFPFIFEKEGIGVVLLLAIVLGMTGLLDKYLVAPLMRRRV
jgi:anti-sigma factor RsiW